MYGRADERTQPRHRLIVRRSVAWAEMAVEAPGLCVFADTFMRAC